MKKIRAGKFKTDVASMIRELSGPDYITDFYSDIGIKSLIILSSVFRADSSYYASYMAKFLFATTGIYKNKKVLDLGCGCGVLGVMCALRGARNVHFSDINPVAIKNSRLNSILMGVENTNFSCGSLFEGLPAGSRFDVIIFNSPTTTGVPANIAESSFIREDALIRDFYATFPNFLSKNGIVIVPFSTRFDKATSPFTLAKKYQYEIKVLDKDVEDDGNYKSIVEIKIPLHKS